VEQVVAAGSSNCVLLEGGDMKCWGRNVHGQLGYEDTETRGNQPGQMGVNLSAIDLGSNLTAVTLAMSFPQQTPFAHTCAILSNLRLKCWGYGLNGRLGTGDELTRGAASLTMGDNLPPVDLGTTSGGQPLTATGMSLLAGGTCVVLSTDEIKCFGANSNGQLGYGTTVAAVGATSAEMGDALPAVNVGPDDILRFDTGGDHSCTISGASAAVKCWGWGVSGRLGNEATASVTNASLATVVDTGIDGPIFDIQLGFTHTCALAMGGGVKCWGSGFWGQLGLNSTDTLGGSAGTLGDALPWVNLCPPSNIFTPEDGTCKYCSTQSVPLDATSCIACGAGTFANLGDQRCRQCPAGQIRAEGSGSGCQSCTIGFIPNLDASACDECPPGSFAPAGASSCIVCEGAQVASLATGACEVCEAGSIPDANRVVCLPCPPGQYAEQNDTRCTPCPPGTISQHGYGACEPCPGGFAPFMQSDSCIPCRPGLFAPPGALQCLECDDATFSSEESSDCTTCRPWHYVIDRDAEDCLGVFLRFLVAVVLQFFGLWFVLGMCRGPIKITDITEVEGKVVVTCNRWHSIKLHEETRNVVRMRGTGVDILDDPRDDLVARGLDTTRFELLGMKSMEKMDVESSGGTMVPSHVWIRHCPESLSATWAYILVALRTIILAVMPWLLILYDPRDAADSLLTVIQGIIVGTIIVTLVCAKIWLYRWLSKTPLDKRLIFFLSSQKRQLRRAKACPLGAERGLRVQELLEFNAVFKDFLVHRSLRYLVHNIIKPLTKKHQISLAELAGSKTLTYYVSTPDEMKMDEVVASILRHSKCVHPTDWKNLSYWMRAWSINIWDEDVELGLGVWSRSAMHRALTSPQCLATLMVTDLDAMPLRRAWCLVEMLETFRRQKDTPTEDYDGLHLCSYRGVLGVGDDPHFDHAIGIGRSLAGMTLDEVSSKSRAEDGCLRNAISASGGPDAALTFFKGNLWSVLEAAEPDIYWDGLCAKRESSINSLRDAAHGKQKMTFVAT